jgi:hypothetical protein
MIRVSSLEESITSSRCSARARSAAAQTRRAATPTCSSPPLAIKRPPRKSPNNRDFEPAPAAAIFGHLAYAADNIQDTCNAFIARGVTINRPSRDGRMSFIRTPDGSCIELLQAGAALAPAQLWTSIANTGSW